MDERLPLGSLSATTLRILLEQERVRHGELEQEVNRLQAGLARQNAIIMELQERDAGREQELAALRTLAAGLQEQNALLRHQVAALEQENARLRGTALGRAASPPSEVKPASQERERTRRKRRAPDQNAGRRRMERATRWQTHVAEQCPQCGEQLAGGWIVRRVQVIDLPPRAPLEITEHRILRRQCPRCGRRVLPRPVGSEAGRIGRCRFGPRLMAAIAVMATVERLPGRVIQERLQREYGLTISHGGIIGLLQRVAETSRPVYDQLQADIRGSPVVHADETGWREAGRHTTVWIVSTTRHLYVHHGRRTSETIDGLLSPDFAGTIVSDCYAAYDHFLTSKQRCWAYRGPNAVRGPAGMVRELEGLLAEHEETSETLAWVEGILGIYQQACRPRAAQEAGWTLSIYG
jgi:predicted RNA-binding Zn-ribbon protein involved in translation (DUF1610 family)